MNKLNPAADELLTQCRASLEEGRRILDSILAADGPRDATNTLHPFNELGIRLSDAGCLAEVFSHLHPRADVREAAERAEREVRKFATELSLNRPLYEAISRPDIAGLDPAARRLVEKTLLDFRRAGVDRDDATRAKILELQEEIVRIGQDFGRTLREDVRTVEVESLAGLPEDYVRAHPPGEDGKIRITTDYPDVIPFMQYARDDDTRRRLSFAFRNRGNPANIEPLGNLLSKRHELARTLGYPHWAAYIVEDKMARDPELVREFIEEIARIAAARARKEYDELLEVKRADDPAAETVETWQSAYYSNRVKESRYAFDPQEARPYFEFSRVKQGILDLSADLFGLRFERIEDAQAWHPSVEVHDVFEKETNLHRGRIYLDLHPRDGKYKHAAQTGLRVGVSGRQIPEGVLMCNFPDPAATQGPALMEHGEVKTFFHEFGHLLHHILGGDQGWIRFSGVATEWDFVEAPSQLLEEWVDDADVLRRFALHWETGEPIPSEMVERMKRANEFGRGLGYRQQTFYAMLSLRYYDEDPRSFDPTRRMIELEKTYSPYPHQDGTHFHLSFGHLDGYSAMYYTYAWSKVIAKDLFGPFRERGLLDPETARAYREKVLAPGGSRDAADLVSDFLGRPYSFDAFRRWLLEE